MENEKQGKANPIFLMIIRLMMIYTAATCFFRGLQNWRDENYLEAVIWFLLSLSQIGQIFGLFRHESKVVRQLIWTPLIIVLILIVLRWLL